METPSSQSNLQVQFVQAVQPLRSVQNDLNDWNGLNVLNSHGSDTAPLLVKLLDPAFFN